GLLGNDLLGFHLRSHCLNFLDCVDALLESRVDREENEVYRAGHTTRVRPFPISIDVDAHQRLAGSRRVASWMQCWRRLLDLRPEQRLGIGIDRIDYTKGLPERFRALDRLFEEHPRAIGRVVFAQIGVPSRTHVPAYQRLNDEIDHLIAQINGKWS